MTAPGKIVLSGRLNLPQGFGPTAYDKRKDAPQRSLDSAGPSGESSVSTSRSKGVASANKTSKLADIAEGDEQSGDSSGSEDSDSKEEHEDDEGRYIPASLSDWAR